LFNQDGGLGFFHPLLKAVEIIGKYFDLLRKNANEKTFTKILVTGAAASPLYHTVLLPSPAT
jgi:hypothetical protein